MLAYPHNLSEVFVLIPQPLTDFRGHFAMTFSEEFFANSVSPVRFVQENQIVSKKHVFRGFHYSLNGNQGKLVSSLHGDHISYALDMRQGSPTQGKCEQKFLSPSDGAMFRVPPGFDHGLLCLTEGGRAQYKSTTYYDGPQEKTLSYKAVNLPWPDDMIVAEKDLTTESIEEFWRKYG